MFVKSASEKNDTLFKVNITYEWTRQFQFANSNDTHMCECVCLNVLFTMLFDCKLLWQNKCASISVMMVMAMVLIEIDIGPERPSKRERSLLHHAYNWIKIIGLLLVGKINLNCAQTQWDPSVHHRGMHDALINASAEIERNRYQSRWEFQSLEKTIPINFLLSVCFQCNLPKIMHLVYLPCFMFPKQLIHGL